MRLIVAISCGLLGIGTPWVFRAPGGQASNESPANAAAAAPAAAGAPTSAAPLAQASPMAPKDPPPWHQVINAWKAQEAVPKDPADNSFCMVCHLNYEYETLVKDHKPAGVGCEACHGISDKHSEDEDGLIPPDVLYVKTGVDEFCLACHPKEELAGPNEHAGLFAQPGSPAATEVSGKTCAECHAAEHQLTVRTRRWNKQTRKLEWSDGVRMMTTRPE